MRLIPPTIAESTQSGGERVVFDALAAASAGRAAGAGGADVAGGAAAGPGADAQVTEQPWLDRLAPLVREPGDDEEEEEVGDWLAACIPSDLDAAELRSSKMKYSSIYRIKGLEAPAVVITDVHALDTRRSARCSTSAARAPCTGW